MRRVVGSTLAAETQSLLNGLGHAEWSAAHFAEARFPDFDVTKRPLFLRHFQIQCIVDAKSLYDHLISLSSPSSVEDKRCGFDLVISRQCMQRLGATIRWAPTNRQLADALTKDSADPVDLLRSCMRSGEYQLSPEHVILEGAAAERSRRKQRQASSQSSSLQSKPVVSSNAFVVQSGVCLTRKMQVQEPMTMLDRAKEQLIKFLQTYRTYCESRKVLPPLKCGERAAAMLRCPARSVCLVPLEDGSESNR